MAMNGKMRITLLLMVSFTLFGPLTAIAAGEYPSNIRLSEDKLRYKEGGPKAATISLPARQATQPPETPKATISQPAQQAAVSHEKPREKPKAATVTRATQQAAALPSEKPKTSLTPARRTAPSFNCAKASNAVERAICADPVLAEMDVVMAADYRKALQAVPDQKTLRAEQRQWLRQMHSQCANGAFQCIQHHYGTRSSQLRSY
jgi:uncharacterized protein YecT (DUF1311 family)